MSNLNRKNLWAGVIGNTFEWYDFALFGAFATTISSLFFPEESPQIALLKSYGIFATGFIMRPLGSLFFGYIGDTRGRKASLFLSILFMMVPTACVGLLPTYNQVGQYAPLLLILMRLLQGFAMGGEYGGSMVFLYEHSPKEQKGFFSSWADVGCLMGVLIGTFLSWLLLNFMDHDTLTTWGWRLPFMGSIILACLVIYFRQKVDETEVFEDLKKHKKNNASASKNFLQHISLAVCVYAFGNVSFYVFLVFIPNFLVQTNSLYTTHSLLVTSLMSLVIAIVIPIGGHLSDLFGRKKIMTIAIIICALLAYPMFFSMLGPSIVPNFILQGLFALSLAIFYGVEAAFISEIFQSTVRCRGVSISLSLTNILFGGSTPFFASWIVYRFNDVKLVSFLILFVALLAMLSLAAFSSQHTKRLFTPSETDLAPSI